MLKEFKAFIMRGSVLDLAVGIIIGAAFGKIVSSLWPISSCRRLAWCWVGWISPTFS